MDMEIDIVSMKERELVLNIKDEDISILYILQHELLKDKRVEFAGFSLMHPLKVEYTFRIVSDDPVASLEHAIRSASERVKILGETIGSSVDR